MIGENSAYRWLFSATELAANRAGECRLAHQRRLLEHPVCNAVAGHSLERRAIEGSVDLRLATPSKTSRCGATLSWSMQRSTRRLGHTQCHRSRQRRNPLADSAGQIPGAGREGNDRRVRWRQERSAVRPQHRRLCAAELNRPALRVDS